MLTLQLALLVAVSCLTEHVQGHGMMLDPPNRSSLWRFDDVSPPNYDDDGNFCGGMQVQWDENDGKCGLCGDNYRDSVPRANENTGTYGLGKIVKSYKSGSQITAGIMLTANHKGWFRFSVCKLNDAHQLETEECFQPVLFANGDEEYALPSHKSGYYPVDLKLPEGLSCDHCVLRWYYKAGNNWGDCGNGTQADGCGPQETFWSCSDITIN